MNNKKIGNDFEQELCEILADAGFWVHNFANRKNGQPADIIAAQGRLAFLIDAKVCSHDIFRFSRMEENQKYAMEQWLRCGNGNPYFALKTSKGVYMVAYDILRDLEQDGKTQLNAAEFRYYGVLLDMWVKMIKSSV